MISETERVALGRALGRAIDAKLEPMREVLRLALARIESLEAANAKCRISYSRQVGAPNLHKHKRNQKEEPYARRLR